ncbi:hypothetical protein CQW23_03699 [Capsicum baccatum]|uniref:MADS-box domain-containing protein n=1 Tax=Capsicum baccatum TaxID=33114 RepID=A0A2G2XCJ5_CAPBA|nr:hypothetical protein CQW23_03699 [Capsicum baccatum]
MAKKGRQKIVMKLIECEQAYTVTFSKRKKALFKEKSELSIRPEEVVDVILFSSGKPCSYGTTCIEKIIDNFFDVKLEDRQRDHVDVGKSNVFKAFEDLCKESQALDMKLKQRRIRSCTLA